MEENATTGGTVQLLTQYQAADCSRAHTQKKLNIQRKSLLSNHKALFINRYPTSTPTPPFRSDMTEYFQFLCCNVKGLISNWPFHQTMQGSCKHWREETHFDKET